MPVKCEVEDYEHSGIRPAADKAASRKSLFPGTGDGTASVFFDWRKQGVKLFTLQGKSSGMGMHCCDKYRGK